MERKRSSSQAKTFKSVTRFPMVARQPQFSPKQIADALQVSESSVKRWCDCGKIASVRTGGGHRRVTLEGLRSFLTRSSRSLNDPEVLGLPKLDPGRFGSSSNASQDDFAAFGVALAAGDEQACREILLRQASLTSSVEAAESLIRSAMQGIGKAWQCDEMDVYQERRACEICVRLINRLRNNLVIAGDAPIAIGGTPSGDPYQLPTTLVELSLREAGWNAVNLGSNLPMESFLQAAHDQRPKIVWLSVSSISDPEKFVTQQNVLAERLHDEIILLMGGRALNDEIRPRLRYTAHCDSVRSMVELATMLVRPR